MGDGGIVILDETGSDAAPSLALRACIRLPRVKSICKPADDFVRAGVSSEEEALGLARLLLHDDAKRIFNV